MAKSTKQMSAETGESGGEPVKKKVASRKKVAKKADAPSADTVEKASAGKPVTRKAATKKPAASKTATSKAAARKSPAKEVIPEKAAAKKAAPAKKAAAGAAVHRQISSAERRRMIAEAAYLRAESQGFLSDEREDWLIAEAEVDGLLMRTAVIVRD